MADSMCIEAMRLEKRFGRTVALEEVSLAVPAGAVYALVGANGAGKSTLIKVLMGILEPTAGRIEVMQRAPGALVGRALRRVGYVSENQELPEWMTVAGLLAYLRPFYPQWDRELEESLLRRFELPLDRKLKHLSRGMRMKAAFVGSLAYRPELVILDEPLSGLDPLVRDELVEALRELRRAGSGMTILLSTHDLAEIEGLATHTGFLERGRMLFSEETAALKMRYRRVKMTGDAELLAVEGWAQNWPEHWSRPEAEDDGVAWVDSSFDAEVCAQQVAKRFGGAGVATYEEMPLRSIFVAVARSRGGTGLAHGDGAAGQEG